MIHQKLELANLILIIGMSRRTGPSGSYKRTLHDATVAGNIAEQNWINANRPPTDGRGGYHLNNPFANVTNLHLTRSERVAKSVRRIKDSFNSFPSVVRFSAIVGRKDIPHSTDSVPTERKEDPIMLDDIQIDIPSIDIPSSEPTQLSLPFEPLDPIIPEPPKDDSIDYNKPITPIIYSDLIPPDPDNIIDKITPDYDDPDGDNVDPDGPARPSEPINPVIHDHLFTPPWDIFSNNPYAEQVERMARRPLPPVVQSEEKIEEEEVTSLWNAWGGLIINGALLVALLIAVILWWIFSKG